MMVDALEYAQQCPHCRDIVTHITALRKLVRPARDLVLETEKHLGDFLMLSDKTDEMQDLMARCLVLREMLTGIIATAQIRVDRQGELAEDDADGLAD